MLTILVIRGALLEGAGIGIENYVGSFNVSVFASPELWKDAVGFTHFFKLKFRKINFFSK